MGYYDLPKGNANVELGRKIYMKALSDRRGFRDDQIGIEDPDIWREIFESIGKIARRTSPPINVGSAARRRPSATTPPCSKLREPPMQISDEMVKVAAEAVYAVSVAAIEPGLGLKMCKFADLESRDLKLHMDYAEAALTAALALSGWQDIATAPKDVSVLLGVAGASIPVYCGRQRYGNCGEPQQDVFAWRCDSSGRFANPTHWKPLDAPPATDGKEG